MAEPIPVPEPAPDDPAWARGIVLIIKTLFSQSIVAQILILGGLITNLVGLFIVHNNQTETHQKIDATKTELKADVEGVKEGQKDTHEKLAVTNEKLTAIKADVRKGPAVKEQE